MEIASTTSSVRAMIDMQAAETRTRQADQAQTFPAPPQTSASQAQPQTSASQAQPQPQPSEVSTEEAAAAARAEAIVVPVTRGERSFEYVLYRAYGSAIPT